MATAIIVLSIVCLVVSAIGAVIVIVAHIVSGETVRNVSINVPALIGIALAVLCLVYFL